MLRRFKDGDAPVFLISLKAGGFGLNLTEADPFSATLTGADIHALLA